MRPARIIGIGASAGGIEALFGVLGPLPEDFPHAVAVVLHVGPRSGTVLPKVLAGHCRVPVVAAEHGTMMRAGCVYVAPADHHLLVAGSQIRLWQGPKENGVRPAIDTTLRSIAVARGPGAVAVVLSGALGDGSGGARAVAAAGGRVLIQDPAEALVPSMPEHAIKAVPGAATVLSAAMIGARLRALSAPSDLQPPDIIGAPLQLAGGAG